RRNLERADEAETGYGVRADPGDVAATVEDFPGAHRQKVGDEIETGRLARAIGTDERVDGPATNVEPDAIDGREPGKRSGQSDSLQNVLLAQWIGVSTSMLDQRTVALVERSPSVLDGNGRKLFIVVPRALALLGLLDLE